MIASRQIKRKTPDEIMPVLHLFDDLEVLSALMKDKDPAKVPARHERTIEVAYGFGDASGRSLGSTAQTVKDGKINVRIGVWSVHEEKK